MIATPREACSFIGCSPPLPFPDIDHKIIMTVKSIRKCDIERNWRDEGVSRPIGQGHARLATPCVVAIAESYAGVFQDRANVRAADRGRRSRDSVRAERCLCCSVFAVESASNELMTEKIVPPPKKGATKPRPVRRPQDATPTSDERIHPPRGRQWLLIANYSMFMHEVDS